MMNETAIGGITWILQWLRKYSFIDGMKLTDRHGVLQIGRHSVIAGNALTLGVPNSISSFLVKSGKSKSIVSNKIIPESNYDRISEI